MRQAKLYLRVCQVFFLGVHPFSPHLLIGPYHINRNNLERDVKLNQIKKKSYTKIFGIDFIMMGLRFPCVNVLVIFPRGSKRTISSANVFIINAKLVNLAETGVSKEPRIETLNSRNRFSFDLYFDLYLV